MQENEFWNKLKKWKIIITIEPTLDSIDRPISKTDIFSQSKADNLQIYDSVLEVGILEPDVDNDTQIFISLYHSHSLHVTRLRKLRIRTVHLKRPRDCWLDTICHVHESWRNTSVTSQHLLSNRTSHWTSAMIFIQRKLRIQQTLTISSWVQMKNIHTLSYVLFWDSSHGTQLGEINILYNLINLTLT